MQTTPRQRGGEIITNTVQISVSKANTQAWESFKKRHPTNTSEAIMRLIRIENSKYESS